MDCHKIISQSFLPCIKKRSFHFRFNLAVLLMLFFGPARCQLKGGIEPLSWSTPNLHGGRFSVNLSEDANLWVSILPPKKKKKNWPNLNGKIPPNSCHSPSCGLIISWLVQRLGEISPSCKNDQTRVEFTLAHPETSIAFTHPRAQLIQKKGSLSATQQKKT